jgi:hypothetical protein
MSFIIDQNCFDFDIYKAPRPELDIMVRLAPAKTTVVYDTYWRFAKERQDTFFRRFNGEPAPWTSDPILRVHKFTNAYRASDRVSQYLIKNVIYTGDQIAEEVVFRILLFKFFNKIETWELLSNQIGSLSYSTFNCEQYDSILSKAICDGKRIYSAAYIMPSGGKFNVYGRKHSMHLNLLKIMMADNVPNKIADAKNMGQAFDILRGYPTIGDFLGYQYITDINYSNVTNFSEMDFVVPGPGARDGIKKCFSDLGGLTEAEIIKVVAERQNEEFSRLGLSFQSLWGRELQLIDCQNLFCEVDKYSRIKHPEIQGITGRTRIKQKYQIQADRIQYWYPPKWKINDKIRSGKTE